LKVIFKILNILLKKNTFNVYLVDYLVGLKVTSFISTAFINKAIKNPIAPPPTVANAAFMAQFLSISDTCSFNFEKVIKLKTY
jgi:hypothetical protein